VPQPAITESCSNVSIVNSINQTADASGYYPVGTTIIDWVIADECGNTSTCSMTVTIIDNEAPHITCPEDILICSTEQLVLVPPTDNDNCGEVILSNNAPSTFEPGTTLVVWTATDIYGNTTSCTQTVTITPMVSADAGLDELSCAGQEFTINSASALNYSSVLWTSTGLGLIQNATSLNPTYVAAVGETGNIHLTLTAYGLLPCANVTDEMLLTILPAPIADAGLDATICESQNFITTDAFAGYTGSVNWTTNGNGTFSDPSQVITTYTPGTTDIENGSVTLYLTSSGTPPCGNVSDSMTLTLNHGPLASAGIDAQICQNTSYQVTDATAQYFNSISWTHNGSGILEGENTLTPTYTPSNGETGLVTLTLSVEGIGSCGNISDTKTLTIYPAPSVSAGNDFENCGTTSVFLASATTSGAANVLWTSTGSGSFENPTLVNAIYIPSQADVLNGSVTLTLSVTGNLPCGTAEDQVLVTLVPGIELFAGTNDSTCNNSSFLVTDAIVKGETSISWIHDGQGELKNANSINPEYIPASGESGIVNLIATAVGQSPCGTVTDTISVQVIPLVSVYAGNDITSCLSAPVKLEEAVTLNYSSLLWSTSGTGTFDDATLPQPTYNPGQHDFDKGFVVLYLQANGISNCGNGIDSLRIEFAKAPLAYAGTDKILCNEEAYTFWNTNAANYTSVLWSHSGLGNLSDPTSLNPTYTPAEGETGIIQFVMTAFGNMDCGNMVISDRVILTINPKILINAGIDQDIIKGTSTVLTGTVSGGSGVFSYNWSPENYLVDNTVINPTTLALDTETVFMLTLLDMSSGCSYSDDVLISVGAIARPTAVDDYDTIGLNTSALVHILQNDTDPIGLGLDVSIISNPENGTAILYADGSITYTPATNFTGNDTLTYTITDRGMPSRSDTAYVIFTIFPVREIIEIYNLVTPNGDGSNDYWHIGGIDEYPDNEVTIFNRWGDKIREISKYNNSDNSWTGTNEKEEYLPDGVYYYVLKIKNLKTYTGWIYIRATIND
jgi:gliding motility-associated-like protein